MSRRVLVLDNGAGLCKAGWTTDAAPQVSPNAVMKNKGGRRTYVGGQIAENKSFASLFFKRPFEKGFMVDSTLQGEIWSQVFGKDGLQATADADTTTLVLTEPPFNFGPIRENMHEMIFEDFQFNGCYYKPAASLCAEVATTTEVPCCLVVDSGFSFTNVIPYHHGQPILAGVRRLDLGGKHLTSYLKDLISYRQLDVSEETWVVNQLKEDTCFVAKKFTAELRRASFPAANNPYYLEYVLPDFTTVERGYIRAADASEPLSKRRKKDNEDEAVLRLCNERFRVPEILFSPSDIGLGEQGITDCIVDAVTACAPELQPALYGNIILIGGNARLPGFRERVLADVQANCPTMFTVQVVDDATDPMFRPWTCGKELSTRPDFHRQVVTKAEYEEHGHKIFNSKLLTGFPNQQ